MGKKVISAILTFKDQNFASGMRKANKQAGDFGRQVNVVQNKVENFKQSATNSFKAIGKASAALGAASITALGAAVGKTVLDMDSAFAKLQAQTGVVGTDLQALEGAAKEAFSRGYGESLDEVTNAVARVKQNMQNLDNGEIANVTSNVMMLANVFESDVNEVTRGANNMMQSFGIEAEKAFDLFAAGGSRGLNKSNEMFDNVAEYSSLFATMGYSAEEYFGILERGAQNSVYSLDFVNDIMKEFQILTKDGSKRTSDAMGKMSSETQNVWKEFLKGNGTVKDVASKVVNELKGMENQTEAGRLGVQLFGTQFENLEADAVYAMLGTTEAMKGFEGATQSASDAFEGGFVNRIKSAYRDLTVSIASLADNPEGKEFLDSLASTAEGLVPSITSVAEKALEFGNTIRDNWTPIKETVIGITTAVVAFKLGMMGMTVISTVSSLMAAYRAALATGTAAQWGMNIAMNANPIGLIVAGIAAAVAIGVVLYRNWDTIKEKAGQLWQKLNENPFTSFLLKLNPITGAAQLIYQNFDKIKASFGRFKDAISNFKLPSWVTTIGGAIGGAVNAVRNKLPSFDVGTNRVSSDMTANIHKDEMIIPARQAQKVRQAGGTIDNIDKLISGNKTESTPSINTVGTQTGNKTFQFGNIIIQGVENAEEAVQEFIRLVKLELANI